VVKEVGCGISGEVARRLAAAGVGHIDVSGRGGTSWPGIETMRDEAIAGAAGQGRSAGARGGLFASWGIPTPEAIREVSSVPRITVIAGGGVRNGLDIAKSLALGAHLASAALPFVRAAFDSEAALDELLSGIRAELRLAMFGVGAADIAALRRAAITRELKA
jgi:isopentenyl-diphosphate delta-isomerase